jgi:TPR repeat protein
LSAEQGNAFSLTTLGVMYRDGEGVPMNITVAIDFLRKASSQGDVRAQINLGNIYAHGEGVKPDVVEAAKWYCKAVLKGSFVAKNALAQLSKAEAFKEAKATPDCAPSAN